MVRRSRVADNATKSYVVPNPLDSSQLEVCASHSNSSKGVFCGLTVECWREHERRHVPAPGAFRHATPHDVSWLGR